MPEKFRLISRPHCCQCPKKSYLAAGRAGKCAETKETATERQATAIIALHGYAPAAEEP
ncbi:MAG: hypothetical protein IKI93_20155 [Clostridia bacterium]|nr:hypothetical protein [Clostridia bacterium]